jgi:hypothetical protein
LRRPVGTGAPLVSHPVLDPEGTDGRSLPCGGNDRSIDTYGGRPMSGDTPPKATRLRPIPTNYAGITFRSRLEADWALTFDSLGVAWSYEPEGIELPDGERYLPDFWLPKIRTWFEVKGPGVPGRSKVETFAAHLADPTDGIEMGGAIVIGTAPTGAAMTFSVACRYCRTWLHSDAKGRLASPYGYTHSRTAVEACRSCGLKSFVTYDPDGCGMDSRCWACGDKTAWWDEQPKFKRLDRNFRAA